MTAMDILGRLTAMDWPGRLTFMQFPPRPVVRARPLSIYLALTALTLIVFGLWPGFDLAFSRLFFDGAGFMGRSEFEHIARTLFAGSPFVVLAAYTALWLARRAGRALKWAPSGRAMIFLIVTLIVAPELVVNVGLKDHWRRPRPYQTQEFNGPDPFRAWYQTDGGCVRNCSFVSGEASTGFWMVAPASVLPPPAQAPALVAAFAFGAGASLLRLSFGGHYLSDVLLGGLLTLIVIEVARRIIWPKGGEDGEEARGAPSLTAAEVVAAAVRQRDGAVGPGR